MKMSAALPVALLGALLALSPDAGAQCPNSGGSGSNNSGSGPSASAGASDAANGASTGSSSAKSGRASATKVTAVGAPSTGSGGSGIRGGSGRTGPTSGGSSSPGLSACGIGGRPLDSWSTWWARNQDGFVWSQELRSNHAPTTAAGRGLPGRSLAPRAASDRPARSTIYTAIVPSLLELVQTSDDPRVVDAAVRALGATVEEPFQDPVSEVLLPLLADDSHEVRLAATLALGLLGDTESATLVELATCSSEGHRMVGESEVPVRMRAAATLALGYADDPRSVAALIDMVERLPDSEADTKRSAIHALGIMRNAHSGIAVDYLMSKLHDERMEPTIRSAIPTALGRQGRESAVETLLSVLADRDTDRRVNQSVVIGLGQLASLDRADVIEALMDVIDDSSDGAMRHFAFMSVAAIGARDAAPGEHTAAHEKLAKFLGKAVTRPRHAQDRPWAALATGIYVHRHPEQRARLSERLMDAYADVKDPTTRGAFALGLGLAGVHEAGEDLLADFRRTSDEELRGYLALALGFMGQTAATVDFEAAIARKGSSPAFRRSIGLACRLLGDHSAPAAIAGRYEGEASLDGRLGLSEALGVLQHRDGVGPLTRAASDKSLDASSRASACAALGRVAESSVMPWQAALRMDSNYMVDAGVSMDEFLGVY